MIRSGAMWRHVHRMYHYLSLNQMMIEINIFYAELPSVMSILMLRKRVPKK